MNTKETQIDPIVRDYQRYIKAIQLKDVSKLKAEKKNKERNEAWKEYYKIEKECKTLAVDLGLMEDDAFIVPETKAPKKRKAEEVDLTE